MSEESGKRREEESPVLVDYDNLDVAAIMDQIKKRVAARPRPVFDEVPSFSAADDMSDALPLAPGGRAPVGAKGKAKRLLLKVMRPFGPLIKLAVLPVHEELRQTVETLHHTNMRLDYLFATVEKEFRRLNDVLNRRIDEVNEAVHRRMDIAFDDINLLKEYAKLLHNLSHNIVVELTKLKIEEETLKNKARILEKDFDHLGKREKALEREAFK